MFIAITEQDNKIIWNSFEQPYRNKDSHNFWDYSNFGNFKFSKINYQEEIEKLRNK
jgi:hypothetical protein